MAESHKTKGIAAIRLSPSAMSKVKEKVQYIYIELSENKKNILILHETFLHSQYESEENNGNTQFLINNNILQIDMKIFQCNLLSLSLSLANSGVGRKCIQCQNTMFSAKFKTK